jgi:GTP-binding protein LepA
MEIENSICLPADASLPCSAKTGVGVEDILEAIVERVPPPKGDPDGKLQALIFDSGTSTTTAASSSTCA